MGRHGDKDGGHTLGVLYGGSIGAAYGDVVYRVPDHTGVSGPAGQEGPDMRRTGRDMMQGVYSQ